MTQKFLSYGRQSIDQDDIDAVIAVLKSDFLTTGPLVPAFEAALCDFTQEKYALCVNSGTAALHLAYAGLGIGPGDWVIVPGMTFLATANAVRLCGAEVIFADVDPENGLMRPQDLLAAIEQNRDKNIKAVAVVHMTGQTENLAALSQIAQQHHLWVVEDACHAFGTIYKAGISYWIGRCEHSDVVAFSFHPVKTIAMGEGGAVMTKHKKVYEIALRMRNHGMYREPEAFLNRELAYEDEMANPWYYEMESVGLNYRASDINCGLGLSQLKKFPMFAEKRRERMTWYDEGLKALFPVIRPIKKTTYSDPVLHLYSVLIDFDQLKLSRGKLMQRLHEKNIGTQVHYIPVNEQPYYAKRYAMAPLAGAREYYLKTLSLPFFPAMSASEVQYVINGLTEIVK